MRILMMSPVLGEAFGQERVMKVSSQLLRKAGHQVYMLGDYAKGIVPDCDGLSLISDLSRISLTSSLAKRFRLHNHALRQIELFNPDVIHIVDQFDSGLQRSICKNYPTVFTAHLFSPTCPSSTRLIRGGDTCTKISGYSCVWNHHKQGCLSHFKTDLHRTVAVTDYLLRRHSLNDVRVIGAISKYVKDVMIRDGWNSEKIRMIYNPIESLSHIKKAKDAPDNLIFCSSRFEMFKGIQMLIKAISLLKNAHASLWIAGAGQMETELKAIAAKLGLYSKVKFLGWLSIERIREIMKAAKVVVQPNISAEPFGLSVAEAAALGTSVIASDTGALSEIIVDGVSGCLVRPNDAKALAEKIDYLLESESVRQNLSLSAPEYIQKKFSCESHLESTLSAYKEAHNISCAPQTPGSNKELAIR